MKFTICKVFLIIQFLSVLYINKCDIPVHCTLSQIVGEWEFQATPPERKSIEELYDMTCGHTNPSHESTSYKFNMKSKKFTETFTVKFDKNSIAKLTKGKQKKDGRWTMVYDEGFDFHFGKKNSPNFATYFVFSKYGQNSNRSGSIRSKWVSYCYSTLIGWYQIGNKYGCFYGKKKVANANEITNGEATNKQVVVEGSMTEKVFLETKSKVENESPETYRFSESKFAEKLELNAQFKDHAKFVERINSENLSWKAANYAEYEGLTIADLNKMAGRKKSRNGGFLDYNFHEKNEIESNNNLELSNENSVLSLYKSGSENQNSLSSQWNGDNGGRRRNRKNGFLNRNGNNDYSAQIKDTKNLKANLSVNMNTSIDVEIDNKGKNVVDRSKVKAKNLPRNFDWKDYMSEPKSQGACGSCFAVSTISMLEARFRIKYGEILKKYYQDLKDFKISIDHVLQCSVYNQACDGGYSFLVSKFFYQYELMIDKCYKKGQGENKQCHQTQCQDPNLENLKLRVEDYYYVGGAYGKTSEESLMMDLYQNGPLVVSLEPEYSFMIYRSGVYDFNKNTWLKNNTTKPEWQKVDHSVVLVGWGVEVKDGKEIKYWLLQNSWGSRWGEHGYMKFRRGVDLMGIESIGEAAIPSLK